VLVLFLPASLLELQNLELSKSTLYSTGVDNAHVALADGAVNSHYTTINSSIDGDGTTTARTSASGFPIPLVDWR
jgi:hypothetical protein